MPLYDEFSGLNAGYIQELYERYKQNPQAVDPATRAYFEHWTPSNGTGPAAAAPAVDVDKIVGAVNYAQAIRLYGHVEAS
jgi:2-oxoglutarate dehydrogenase E1 component